LPLRGTSIRRVGCGSGGRLGAADVAAVLLGLSAADERSLINQVKALAPVSRTWRGAP